MGGGGRGGGGGGFTQPAGVASMVAGGANPKGSKVSFAFEMMSFGLKIMQNFTSFV